MASYFESQKARIPFDCFLHFFHHFLFFSNLLFLPLTGEEIVFFIADEVHWVAGEPALRVK
uniref:Uncharacterized protein n=1 Tax=Thermosporothrix sp. COM3 TaxID=2490863 RepID=A0A455SHS5_9CHLR|nr:hypothetical protein KTC_27880 [Thermosporothrix sp. COM3]